MRQIESSIFLIMRFGPSGGLEGLQQLPDRLFFKIQGKQDQFYWSNQCSEKKKTGTQCCQDKDSARESLLRGQGGQTASSNHQYSYPSGSSCGSPGTQDSQKLRELQRRQEGGEESLGKLDCLQYLGLSFPKLSGHHTAQIAIQKLLSWRYNFSLAEEHCGGGAHL